MFWHTTGGVNAPAAVQSGVPDLRQYALGVRQYALGVRQHAPGVHQYAPRRAQVRPGRAQYRAFCGVWAFVRKILLRPTLFSDR
jgi:hypothetical protein